MFSNAAMFGLMVSLCFGALFVRSALIIRVGSAAHYGGHNAISVAALRQRLAAEYQSTPIAVQLDSRLSAWSHDAPPTSLAPSQAHDAMQLHRACRMENCDRKRMAYWTLVADGRIRPDVRAERTAER
ncbi:hypothetical protein HLB23_02025 [Nocardia uniformis]|uniref:Uncharacterized protein n=1 Tax=Nocardia uniformis TaxID=53432 RepID=A0A849C0Z5_9NOCA|nr:hypothetical protein [Nocardia uniformis]NNH68669.1 hypothetical protein [Nocardia uniformis]